MNSFQGLVASACFLLCGCTLALGHAPESARVAEAEIRAEITTNTAKMETIACEDRSDRLAKALADLRGFVSQVIPADVTQRVKLLLIRTGYVDLASAPVATPAPSPSATPAPSPSPSASPTPAAPANATPEAPKP